MSGSGGSGGGRRQRHRCDRAGGSTAEVPGVALQPVGRGAALSAGDAVLPRGRSRSPAPCRFMRLGQREDPDFTFRAMVIRTIWPGATTEQVDQQVTDRIEKKLQEMPYFKWTRSYSKPGESLIVLELQDTAPPPEVPEIWYQVRKKVGDIRQTLPPEIAGPFFNDEFGDVFGTIYAFTGDGFTLAAAARPGRSGPPGTAAPARRRQGRADRRAGRADLRRSVADKRLAVARHRSRAASPSSWRRRTSMTPAGTVHTAERSVPLRVTGQFDTRRRDRGAAARRRRAGHPPRRHRPRLARLRRSAGLHDALRRQAGDRPRRVDDRDRRRAASSATTSRRRWQRMQGRPAGRHRVREGLGPAARSCATRSACSSARCSRRWRSCWSSASSASGCAPALVVALVIPLVLAATFFGMATLRHRPAPGFHRRAGHRARPAGRRRHDRGRDDGAQDRGGHWTSSHAATYAYTSTAFPMLTGTLITAAGFLPIATARVHHRRIHVRDLRGRDPGAADLLVRGRHGRAVHRQLPAQGEAGRGRTRSSTRRFYRGLRGVDRAGACAIAG